MMDWLAIATAAKRAQAAYLMDEAQAKAAFEALGDTFIGRFHDDDSQAVLTTGADGKTYFSLAGTRFSAGKVGDLLDDIDLVPVDMGDGAIVPRGAYESAKELFAWALSMVPDGTALHCSGHSLAGWRLSYTPLFVKPEQIGGLWAFEPPKSANRAYFARHAAALANMVIVGNGADIWVAYPRLGPWMHRPGPMIHLSATGFSIIDTSKWPGGLSLADHDIDTVVVRLEKIAANANLRPAA
jgi:hypothetical protein